MVSSLYKVLFKVGIVCATMEMLSNQYKKYGDRFVFLCLLE